MREARIAELEQRLADMETRIGDLLARLGTNASNSSTPPSANPLGAPKPVVKKKSRRRPGGQPGHRPHVKQLLPPERVHETFVFVPQRCRKELCFINFPVSWERHDSSTPRVPRRS